MEIIFVEKPTYKRFQDLEGRRFGRLFVKGYAGFMNKRPAWWCECDCPNTELKKVAACNLLNDSIKSCGCILSEYTTLFVQNSTTHGMYSDNNEYRAFHNARNRCNDLNNKHYKDYGGRGIEFRFNSFEEFYAELGDKPEPKKDYSLDRIDNDGHYEIENCKWADRREQSRNKRSNIFLTINNETNCLIDWARLSELTRSGIKKRLKNGWCDYCSVTVPPFGQRCPHF